MKKGYRDKQQKTASLSQLKTPCSENGRFFLNSKQVTYRGGLAKLNMRLMLLILFFLIVTKNTYDDSANLHSNVKPSLLMNTLPRGKKLINIGLTRRSKLLILFFSSYNHSFHYLLHWINLFTTFHLPYNSQEVS